jgi:hypothetical protein
MKEENATDMSFDTEVVTSSEDILQSPQNRILEEFRKQRKSSKSKYTKKRKKRK